MSAPLATSASASVRRKLLAKVHIAKQQLGLDDDVYRAVLLRVAGASSAGDLMEEQLAAVVREFRRLGWTPRTASGKRPSDKAYIRKIWAIWTEMGSRGVIQIATRGALRSFVQKMTGISDPQWLDPIQAAKVIEGLKAWRNRELAKGAAR